MKKRKEEEEELGPEEEKEEELVLSHDQLVFCPRSATSPAHTLRSCSVVGGQD